LASRFGDFRVVKPLIEGGTATIYLAENNAHGRVAVKVLRKADARARRALAREYRLLSRLEHPSLLKVYAFGTSPQPYLAMEYFPGPSIRLWLRRDPGAVRRKVCAILEGAGAALGCMHAQGVVHGDVKPENLLLSEKGEVRLIDLSTASTPWARRLRLAGRRVGTVGYLAPEVAAGAVAHVGSDVYALGATAYELLTDQAPFMGGSRESTIKRQTRGTVTAPSRLRSGVPQAVDAILLRMLAPYPSARPVDAALAARQLNKALEGAPLGGEE